MKSTSVPLFPRRITLEFTNHCNLRCVFCPRRFMEKETGFLDVGLARELMAQMRDNRAGTPVTVVPFFRGESLTHPHWDTLLAELHAFGLGPIQMATNASLLTEARAHRLLDIGVDTLSFSMDTLNPETYRHLRGTDYAESLGNVLRFLELRNTQSGNLDGQHGRGGCGTVQVSAVRTAENAHEMDAFVAYWQTKVDRIRIYPEHSADGKLGSLETVQTTGMAERRTACPKVMEDMVIYWNGDVALCNHDWTRRLTGPHLGSVRTQSIEQVWTGPAYATVREAHAMGSLTGVSPCEHCGHWRGTPVGDIYTGQK